MTAEFSVVIPTFHRERELIESIESVLGQAGAAVEIIVVDDSPEGSAEKAVGGLADPRITYVRNASPTGGIPSIVRNLGWPLAQGQFVHFLDDDDLVTPGHYAAVKETFATRPHVGMVFGRIEPFGSCPDWQLEHERQYFASAARKAAACRRFGRRFGYSAEMLFDVALLVCSASIVRRTCLAPLGGFDPSIRLMEDADFHVRMMREFGAYFLDRTAVRYRIGSPSLMHSPHADAAQRRLELEGRRRMQAKYRAARGTPEYYLLALLARSVLRRS